MKKILFAIAALFVFACSNNVSERVINIGGEIKGLEKGNAFVYLESDKDNYADSVAVKGGKFTLRCNIGSPQILYIYIKDDKENLLFGRKLFSGGGNITVQMQKDEPKSLQLFNARLDEKLRELMQYIRSLDETKKIDSLGKLIVNAYKQGDKSLVNELDKQRGGLVKDIIDSLFKRTPGADKDHVVAYRVCEYAYSLPLEDQMAIVKRFSSGLNSYYLNSLKENIRKEMKVAEGSPAPDFKVKDLQGKEYSLADFKGKYIFLEFSASWCGWCKREIPFIREAYNMLKDKEMVFITMNMDTKKENWEEDVKKHNIEWFCLSDLKGMESALAEAYNIRGVPACFVIDPAGIIIQKDVRGNEVIKYLSGLF